ncbi:MAG TPA: trypsin-like peptidase domain-containing protein [Tepidisphaeraceae bacterium]|nr:trypsin-like peptidase domain-containing protein [Tepidisphaeraceae bacterium]
MKHVLCHSAVALIGAFLVAGCAQHAAVVSPPYPSATPEAVTQVTNAVFPAVVRIDVKQERYAEGKRKLASGIGSGVIIDPDGHILTNYHVAGCAAEIYITLSNKERVPARLIGDDHWTDLAVLQMDMETIRSRNIAFKHAPLGTSDTLVPGQDVMAIGTPFGFARTLTLGVVSNTDRTFYPERQRIDQYETGDFANWIQMDTPINPGNSGGPLVDMTGQVVGINTRGGGQNLNFAIPIDIAKEVVAKILATATPETKGHVDRSDLGLDLKPLQGFEDFYNIDINKGVLIEGVDRNSPAAKAGVQSQDILLELNAQPTNVRFPEELASLRKRIADLPIGSQVTLTLKRGKETLTRTLATERLQSSVGEEREFPVWGFSVRDITRAFANARQLDDDRGVVVTSLSLGYPGAKAELLDGDIITRVNDHPVTDLAEFTKLYSASIKRKDPTILIDLVRRRAVFQAVMKITY